MLELYKRRSKKTQYVKMSDALALLILTYWVLFDRILYRANWLF